MKVRTPESFWGLEDTEETAEGLVLKKSIAALLDHWEAWPVSLLKAPGEKVTEAPGRGAGPRQQRTEKMIEWGAESQFRPVT